MPASEDRSYRFLRSPSFDLLSFSLNLFRAWRPLQVPLVFFPSIHNPSPLLFAREGLRYQLLPLIVCRRNWGCCIEYTQERRFLIL